MELGEKQKIAFSNLKGEMKNCILLCSALPRNGFWNWKVIEKEINSLRSNKFEIEKPTHKTLKGFELELEIRLKVQV